MKLELQAIEKRTGEMNLQQGDKSVLTETYDGGFHISRKNSVGRVNFPNEAANERVANVRSSLQGFTCK